MYVKTVKKFIILKWDEKKDAHSLENVYQET